MAPLGKRELLAWAEDAGGVRPCAKYADLRDGVVFLALFSHLFPGSVDSRVLRRGPLDVERNWDTLRRLMERHGLPLRVCDRHAVAAGHARHCFNMLVLFYFLTRLAHDSEFRVDFANPIDPVVADFLQSPQSLRCVGKVPAGATAAPPEERKPTRAEERGGEAETADERGSEAEILRVEESDGGRLESVSGAAERAQLRAELEHVRAASRLALAQQRVLVAAEVSRAAEQFEARLALSRLEAAHGARRELLQCRAELEAVASAAPGADPNRVRAAQLRAAVAALRERDETVDALRAAVLAQRARHEALATRVAAICADADETATDAEAALVAAVRQCAEGPLRDAAALRLRAVFAENRALRAELAQRGGAGSEVAAQADEGVGPAKGSGDWAGGEAHAVPSIAAPPPPRSLLSPEELERRKMEILGKYGFSVPAMKIE